MDQDETWQVGLGPGHIVLDGDPDPLSQRGTAPPPVFWPYLLWPNGSMDQDATWYVGRPRPRPHCARWGPGFPSQKRGIVPPIFGPFLLWPNSWMVGLGPGNIVLDTDPASPPPRGTALTPNFVCCGQTAGWMKMPLGTNVSLDPGRIVLHGEPAPLPKVAHLPCFRPMAIVAKWSPILATAEHLSFKSMLIRYRVLHY